MKTYTQLQVQEIAEEMSMGFKCYWNKKTNQPLFIIDDESMDMDDEDLVEQLQELEKNGDDYVQIDKPLPSEAFEIMKNFAESLIENLELKTKLLTALEEKKPFGAFNDVIFDYDEEADKWFEFKDNNMQKWVRDQLDLIV